MKKCIKLIYKRIARINLLGSIILLGYTTGTFAQNDPSVTGKLIDRNSNLPVPFANVVLLKASDSTFVRGTVSDESGTFTIHPAPKGMYKLLVSIIGYEQAAQNIDVANKGVTDAGTIFLQDKSIVIRDMEVVGERLKAKSEQNKTTFFMTKKIIDASSSGTDVLKNIPGVQIDFMQNISLEGGRNIQILVDGKERDRSFVSQLNPRQIDKVEVISKPSSNYDGNVTGAINIVLKKERDAGFSGQFFGEVPAFVSDVFIHPTYSLNYGFNKVNLFTSYQGEMVYLDQSEHLVRKTWNSSGSNNFTSDQFVRQKTWSHRFNYGFDYLLDTHNQFNFYAFFNPYSQEHDGNSDAQVSGNLNKTWKAKKEDADLNNSTFYSLYYKHWFEKEGREITFDISNYNLVGSSSTDYTDESDENKLITQTNRTKPRQHEMTLKTDYTSPLGNKLTLGSGIKAKFMILEDRYVPGFQYTERCLAAYGTLAYKESKFDINTGLRAERSVSELKNSFKNPVLSFFPHATFKYNLTSGQSFQVSYNRSVRRPNLYQLNPNTSIVDPYTLSKGNPFLKPEYRSSIFAEYSHQFKSNYMAIRLFYNGITNAISNLMFINDTNAFETQVQNLGTIHQFGMQFLATLKVGIASINPYLQFYDLYTSGNSLAREYIIRNKRGLGFESGLSAIVSFKYDLSLSVSFQYASPKSNIQDNAYCDAVYFISLDKGFGKKLKVGVTTAMPFTRSFIYQGSDINGVGFSSRYKGVVAFSAPFWFKLSYQFNSGKNRDKINRVNEGVDNRPKKGF